MASVPPDSDPDCVARPQILGATVDWNGAGLQLGVSDKAVMKQTPEGSMIFAFENRSLQNNSGKLSLLSGAGPPEIYTSPALLLQPMVLARNWRGGNLDVTNISANNNTPIWIAAFGPGIGPKPQPLPIGQTVAVAEDGTLQGTTNANWMQLTFTSHSSQLALFGFIGGPADASGNNAYAVALNSPDGDTGPPPNKKPPTGYFATARGNTFSYMFNWGATMLFIAYFGSGRVVPTPMTDTIRPTVTLLSL